ncbi:hypothetical protein DPMN_128145 [Dreissena polymorpha]|uniref:Uncharacterized protein n=1 Tax=Dreissena polymorpha TaxID=45954 RepID=A0A9D4JX50_DREPO|nr:hypothetical protein DPMN_128145 [Dreissena polymorpha]
MIGQKLKTALLTRGHVFQRIGTTFELNQDIIKTNILTNFELGKDFIGTKLLTKFHEDGTINVASRVFTSKSIRKNSPPYGFHFHNDRKLNVISRAVMFSNGMDLCFTKTETICKLIQDIVGTHGLAKFHKDWTI